jgi:hypothetical protein
MSPAPPFSAPWKDRVMGVMGVMADIEAFA